MHDRYVIKNAKLQLIFTYESTSLACQYIVSHSTTHTSWSVAHTHQEFGFQLIFALTRSLTLSTRTKRVISTYSRTAYLMTDTSCLIRGELMIFRWPKRTHELIVYHPAYTLGPPEAASAQDCDSLVRPRFSS